MLFHADLSAQESAVFSYKGSGDHIAPDTARGADFQLLRGDIAADGPGDDYGAGANIFTGNPRRPI